jgi:hypothetical protein
MDRWLWAYRQAAMLMNGNYWAEQTFPVTEYSADAEFLIGCNRP